jgi:monoamine oxidase
MKGVADATADRPDVLIVGAGIAGLYTAREILKRSPTTRVLVIEKYPVVGGRVLTFHGQLGKKKGSPICEQSEHRDACQLRSVVWEAGAGRLHYSQKRVHALLKEYKLEVFPLSSSADFISAGGDRRQPNNFADLLAPLLPLLEGLPVADLQMHTLADLTRKILGPKITKEIFDQFPYYTEVYNLRADLALETFRNVMGAEEGFCSIKGGFGQLPQALAADVRRRGGSIWLGTELVGWSRDKDASQDGQLKARLQLWRNWKPHTTVTLYPKRMILALHAGALHAFPQTRTWAPLRHLGVARLLRIYAVFPLGPICGGAKGPWFTGMRKIVVAGPLRYIIPINEAEGIIMISYTDGADTQPFWREAQAKDPRALTKHIMREVRALFGPSIPDPIFLKAHPWTVGTTYWRPGRYNVDAVMQDSLHLEDGVDCIGESFSREQAWIEGALESAERLLAQA